MIRRRDFLAEVGKAAVWAGVSAGCGAAHSPPVLVQVSDIKNISTIARDWQNLLVWVYQSRERQFGGQPETESILLANSVRTVITGDKDGIVYEILLRGGSLAELSELVTRTAGKRISLAPVPAFDLSDSAFIARGKFHAANGQAVEPRGWVQFSLQTNNRKSIRTLVSAGRSLSETAEFFSSTFHWFVRSRAGFEQCRASFLARGADAVIAPQELSDATLAFELAASKTKLPTATNVPIWLHPTCVAKLLYEIARGHGQHSIKLPAAYSDDATSARLTGSEFTDEAKATSKFLVADTAFADLPKWRTGRGDLQYRPTHLQLVGEAAVTVGDLDNGFLLQEVTSCQLAGEAVALMVPWAKQIEKRRFSGRIFGPLAVVLSAQDLAKARLSSVAQDVALSGQAGDDAAFTARVGGLLSNAWVLPC